jgi:hypothetical protein
MILVYSLTNVWVLRRRFAYFVQMVCLFCADGLLVLFGRWITKLELLGRRSHQLNYLTVMTSVNLQGERCVRYCRRISCVCGGMSGELCQHARNLCSTCLMLNVVRRQWFCTSVTGWCCSSSHCQWCRWFCSALPLDVNPPDFTWPSLITS